MRCFIALPLPEEARELLAAAAERLKAALPSCSWVRPEGYHITIAFLGEIQGASIECAKAGLESASELRSFTFSFEGIGGFPQRGPYRVIAGMIEDEGGSELVYQVVNEELARHERRAGVGPLNPEWPNGRGFNPHVTIARVKDYGGGSAVRPRDLDALLGDTGRRLRSGQWTIDRCVLYKSELRPSGAEYHELKSVKLGSGANPLSDED